MHCLLDPNSLDDKHIAMLDTALSMSLACPRLPLSNPGTFTLPHQENLKFLDLALNALTQNQGG